MKLELHPITEKFPRMSEEDFNALLEDIKKNGVKIPIILHDFKIIDGRHRYEACQILGLECPYVIWNEEDPWLVSQSLNLIRRHMNKDQVYATLKVLAKEFPEVAKPIEEAKDKAKESQISGLKVGKDSRGDHMTPTGKSSDLIGSTIGVSGSTVKRVDRLEREAPEFLPMVASGEMSATAALREVNLTRRREIQQRRIDKPDGKYNTIVVDPPWPMEKIVRDDYSPTAVGLDYPTMTIDELIEWPIVKDLAAEDSHLYFWTTHKFLPDAFRIIESWGFKYLATMVWVKNGGFQPYNLPQFNCEFVLLCHKGTPQFTDTKNFMCAFRGQRTGHSVKPEEFYQLIDRVNLGPKIDIFARQKRIGWEVYGNEVP